MRILLLILLCCLLTSCGTKAPYEEPAAITPKTVETAAVAPEPEKQSEEKPPQSAETEKDVPATPDTAPEAVPAPSPEPSAELVPNEPAAKTVTIKITGLDSLSLEKSVELTEGMTALDATLLAVRDTDITVDYTGGKSAAYITGIGNLYEKQHGAMSGWQYSVNGARANKSCGKYTLAADDVLEWKYCLDFTE